MTPKQSLEGAGVNQGRGSENISSGCGALGGQGGGDMMHYAVFRAMKQSHIRVQARLTKANSPHMNEGEKRGGKKACGDLC